MSVKRSLDNLIQKWDDVCMVCEAYIKTGVDCKRCGVKRLKELDCDFQD